MQSAQCHARDRGHVCELDHRPQRNGLVERFNRTVVEEFLRQAFRDQLYESVEALQWGLDAWLAHYKTRWLYLGYRDQGRRG